MSSDLGAPGLRFAQPMRVTWGQCDAAGIVYYPRYYEIFDINTHEMLRSAGLNHHHLRDVYGVLGLSLVEAKAQFRAAATFDDLLEVETQVASVGRSSVRLEHVISRGAVRVAEGHEVRVWASAAPGGGLMTTPIPDEVRRILLAHSP